MKSDDDYQRFLDSSFHFLSFRPRSEKELRQFLQKKNQRLVEKIIQRLRELGYVDDEKFVRWWVEQRQGRKPKGKKLIEYELLSKGVTRDIIEQVLYSEIENQDELAKKALQSKLGSLRDRKKLMDFLLRRGFDASTARHAIDESLGKR